MNLRFETLDAWIKFVATWESKDRMEIQANEFAGRLLVPRQRLADEIIRQQDRAWEFSQSADELVGNLAIRLTRVFHVSTEVIEIRLKNEGLMHLINRE